MVLAACLGCTLLLASWQTCLYIQKEQGMLALVVGSCGTPATPRCTSQWKAAGTLGLVVPSQNPSTGLLKALEGLLARPGIRLVLRDRGIARV